MKIPDDIELSFQFRELNKSFGGKAWIIFGILWSQLAAQAKTHGRAGMYERRWFHHLCSALEKAGVETAEVEAKLVESEMLRESGDDYFCPIFAGCNHEMDWSHIPETSEWSKQWDSFMQTTARNGLQVQRKLPKPVWYLPRGGTVPTAVMNRAIVLISTLDQILRTPRKPESMTPFLIQAAVAVVGDHTDLKLSVVLRRFLSLSRPSLSPKLPRTTEDCLRHFDDLIVGIMPNDGFVDWLKKTDIPPYENGTTRTEGIISELAGVHVSEPAMAGAEPRESPGVAEPQQA